jgi:hypothetical protein
LTVPFIGKKNYCQKSGDQIPQKNGAKSKSHMSRKKIKVK